MLARCRRYDATDLRDKVYAIYNLIAESIPGLGSPDYTAPVEQIYTNLASSRYEQGDLELLRHCSRSSLQLPSWVPDWSMMPQSRPLPSGHGMYTDVPWWAEAQDDGVPQTQGYGPHRDGESERIPGRISGYSFRDYQFHGYTVRDEQWDLERAMRISRLESAAENFERVDNFDEVFHADPAVQAFLKELAGLPNLIGVKAKTAHVSSSQMVALARSKKASL